MTGGTPISGNLHITSYPLYSAVLPSLCPKSKWLISGWIFLSFVHAVHFHTKHRQFVGKPPVTVSHSGFQTLPLEPCNAGGCQPDFAGNWWESTSNFYGEKRWTRLNCELQPNSKGTPKIQGTWAKIGRDWTEFGHSMISQAKFGEYPDVFRHIHLYLVSQPIRTTLVWWKWVAPEI